MLVAVTVDVSPELVAMTNVLLELVSVREGVFSLSDFDRTVIQQLIELICIN